MERISISTIKGFGKAKIRSAENLGIFSLLDMLLFSPRTYLDRRKEKKIASVSIDDPTINCRVVVQKRSEFNASKRGRTPLIVVKDDDETELSLLCFNRRYLYTELVEGSVWYISGTVTKSIGKNNVAHYKSVSFEIKESAEEIGLGSILPIYPLSGKLTQNDLRKISKYALNTLLPLREVLSSECIEKYNLLGINKAFKNIHYPENEEMGIKARKTLSFIELYILEINGKRKRPFKSITSSPYPTRVEEEFVSSLPFSLTEDQRKCINEIRTDIDSSARMSRLLQGDVGSGKTLVALITSLRVISSGAQCALMAPTELLSRQHEKTAKDLLSPFGINICFLSGDIKNKERKKILNKIKNGEEDLIVGTHALFSKDVKYKNLKYIIIDEQHRFGVVQRDALIRKGNNPDVLSMSATPIPRTLAETLYAHMDISTLCDIPSGRKKIITYTVSEENRDKMFLSIEAEFKRGHQAYFVYPRIDEDDGLKNVEKMYELLKKKYSSYTSSLLHSRINEDDKIRILKDFKDGKIDYLVSTTLVEVGLDIPKATVMVIENAERYGLAALHQLRGRVGRSELQSYCFLTFSDKLTDDAKKRLRIIKETADGFKIANEDLSLRGPGSFFGSEQSGFSTMHFASIEDSTLLEEVHAEVEKTIDLQNKDESVLSVLNEILSEYVF